MESLLIAIITLLSNMAILATVILGLIKTHQTEKKIDAGVDQRNKIENKIDVLTAQTNGMAMNLAAGNKAIGAAEARREDKAEKDHS